MSLDFNIEPFFDDYSKSENFYRVLFRPGYAVQARELTQLQTILQEQVSRNADHLFKEGAMVIPGQVVYDQNLYYVKLASADNISTIMAELVGKDIQNEHGLIARVITYTDIETVNNVVEPNTLFVKYLNSAKNNDDSVIEFSKNEILIPTDGVSGLNVSVYNSDDATGVGCSASINNGIYYINKTFALVTDQTLVLDKYSNTPSYRVGLQLAENVIYPEENSSILDNASGSPNYAAPGACRYNMELSLVKLGLETLSDVTIEDGFIDLLRVVNGSTIFKLDRTYYSELEKTLARRTYDESGDYALSKFDIQIKNYRNNFRDSWAANEVYIEGDIIRVLRNPLIPNNYLYFVATTRGTSGASVPTWANYASVNNFNDNGIIWEFTVTPSLNNGIMNFKSGEQAFTDFTVNDHIRLDSMIAYAIESGKAYVKGFEIEKGTTEFIPAFKSRNVPAGSNALCAYFNVANGALTAITDSVSALKTTTIDMSMDSFVYVKDVKYLPNIITLGEVTLYSVALNGSLTTPNIIGYARVRGFEKNAQINGVDTYKVFLFGIRILTKKNFADTLSIYTAANAFQCNVNRVGTELTVIKAPNNKGLIWKLPNYAVNNISRANYVVAKSFTGSTSGSPCSVLFTAPSGYTFESTLDDDNYICANNTDGTIFTPDAVNLAAANNIQLINSTTLKVVTATAISITVFGAIRRNAASAVGTKTAAETELTLTEGSNTFTTRAAAQANSLVLSKSFVTRIVSVLMSTVGADPFVGTPVYNVNITSRYTFSNSHTKGVAGDGVLTLVPGAPRPIGPVLVNFEYLYYANTGDYGGFFGVDSYANTNSRTQYSQIPQVANFNLRDCIDFRPIATGSTFVERYFPKYGTIGTFSYTNYLSRTDNVALAETGDFIVTRGIPAEYTTEPATPNFSMKLAKINLEPYTFTKNNKVGSKTQYAENKRYTMRDIGKLERRIQDVEYYTSLTLTELDTKNMRIVDSNGLDRFQNGFFVDSFTTQSLGDVTSEDWNCAIDIQNKELRPFFAQEHINFVVDPTASDAASYQQTGDLISLPYTQIPMITQMKASRGENVNPTSIFRWKGEVTLSPWGDTWFSTSFRPDIVLNKGQYDAVQNKIVEDGVLGTVWDSWRTIYASSTENAEDISDWASSQTNDTIDSDQLKLIGLTGDLSVAPLVSEASSYELSATETSNNATNSTTSALANVAQTTDNRLLDTSLIPYIRARDIVIRGSKFKPSTSLYTHFDNVLVDDYVTGATKLGVTPITGFPILFNTDSGHSVLTDTARKLYKTGPTIINGTVTVTNFTGYSVLTGVSTAFLSELSVGAIIFFSTGRAYTISEVSTDTSAKFTPAYEYASLPSGVALSVYSDKHQTKTPEPGYTIGEQVYSAANPSNTALVIGQEVVGTSYYLYIINQTGTFRATDVLVGQFTNGGVLPKATVVSQTIPTELTTTATGKLFGVFRLPCSPIKKFRTGARWIDFSTNLGDTMTVRHTGRLSGGYTKYVASGTIELDDRSISSTRVSGIWKTNVEDSTTRGLSQSFITKFPAGNGGFVTSIDLYFKFKDDILPVKIALVEMLGGVPSLSELPFSTVIKDANEVVCSIDGSVATRFIFPSLVYLKNNTEYALTITADSNRYAVFVAKIGEDDLVTKSTISTQPYDGFLFKDILVPDQAEDLKFVLNCASFNISDSATLTLIPSQYQINPVLVYDPIYFTAGSNKIRVYSKNHNCVVGEKVYLKKGETWPSSINGISSGNLFGQGKLSAIISCDLDSFVVTTLNGGNATTTGWGGGDFIETVKNFEFSTAMLDCTTLRPVDTYSEYSLMTTEHGNLNSAYTTMIQKQNYAFDSVKSFGVCSAVSNAIADRYKLALTATISKKHDTTSVSPIIDLGRIGLTVVNHRVDAPTPDLLNDVLIDTVIMRGAANTTAFQIGTGLALESSSSGLKSGDDILTVNATSQPELYASMEILNVGSVINIVYSNTVNVNNYFTIMDKTLEGDNMGFLLEGYYDPALVITETSSNTVAISWLSRFKAEAAATGSSITSKYVTKKINFSRPSDTLKILFDALIPSEADIEVYYKTGLNSSGTFAYEHYTKATPTTYLKSDTQFGGVVIDLENLPVFDTLIVKLAMKSTNKAKVPRIKNLRTISCAAI